MTFKEYTRRFDREIQNIINELETARLERLKLQEGKKERRQKEKRLPKILATAVLAVMMLVGLGSAEAAENNIKVRVFKQDGITQYQTFRVTATGEYGTIPLTWSGSDYRATAIISNGYTLTIKYPTAWGGDSYVLPPVNSWSGPLTQSGINIEEPTLYTYDITMVGPAIIDDNGVWTNRPCEPRLDFTANVAPYTAGSPTQNYFPSSDFTNIIVPLKFSDAVQPLDKVGALKFKLNWDKSNVTYVGYVANGQPAWASIQTDALSDPKGMTFNILWNQNTQLDFNQPLLYLKFSTANVGRFALTITEGENRQYSDDNLYWIATSTVSNNAVINIQPGDFNADGFIDVADLALLATHYWAGVPGYVGSHTYAATFDIGIVGPANLITSYVPDNKIEFEDLFAFALNWKRAAANGGILPKVAPSSNPVWKTIIIPKTKVYSGTLTEQTQKLGIVKGVR